MPYGRRGPDVCICWCVERGQQAGRLAYRCEVCHSQFDLLFCKSLETLAIWLYLIGLNLFAAKPTFRLVWKIKLYRLGDYDDLAL